MNQRFRPLHQFQVVRFFSLIMPYGNNHLRLQSPVMSDWSGHAQQQEASLPFFFPHRQRDWPCSVIPQETRASSDAGPKLAGRAAVRRWKARRPWCAPLKRGLGGLRQVIRCRAGVGEQWQPCGDGKPAGPDRPLERGMGGDCLKSVWPAGLTLTSPAWKGLEKGDEESQNNPLRSRNYFVTCC